MKKPLRKFLALDTETINGKAFFVSHAEGFLEPLESFSQFVSFVRSLPSTDFVFYNLDYDVTGLLSHIPEKILKSIYFRGCETFGKFQIRYLPKKHFQIMQPNKPTLNFYDLFSFFQMSLDAVAQKYLPEGFRKNKLEPNYFVNFTYEKFSADRERFSAYAVQDAIVLQKLTDDFFEAVNASGYTCRHYYSPASLAKKALRRHFGTLKPLPEEVLPTIEKSYFGGRIECWQKGNFPAANIYDIKSAYPSAMRDLPDFRAPEFTLSKQIQSKYFLMTARVWTDKPLLPYRLDGVIYFPKWNGNVATFTSLEYDLLRRNGASVEPITVLNIDCPDTRPLRDMVDDLYARRSLGGMEKQVYKLILNSLYGVFAQKLLRWKEVSDAAVFSHIMRKCKANALSLFVQSQATICPEAIRHYENKCRCETCKETRRVLMTAGKARTFELRGGFDVGFFKRRPSRAVHSNLLYATFTTSAVRVRLADLMQTSGVSIIGGATDSVILSGTLPETDGLGGLEKQYSGRVVMVGSGVYQTDVATRFRGFSGGIDLISLLSRAKRAYIDVPQSFRVSMGKQFRYSENLFLPKDSRLNIISSGSKTLSLNFDNKRIWPKKVEHGYELLSMQFSSEAHILGKTL
jgi:hypothetical protein